MLAALRECFLRPLAETIEGYMQYIAADFWIGLLEAAVWLAFAYLALQFGLLVIFLLTKIIGEDQKKRRFAMRVQPNSPTKIFIRCVELVAIPVAVITLLVEFGVDRPRQEAVRKAQLMAQLADFSTREEKDVETLSPAIKNIFERLVRENVPLNRFIFPKGAKLQRAELTGAELSEATLPGVILQRANLQEAMLQGANLRQANLSGAMLLSANLQNATPREISAQSGINGSAEEQLSTDLRWADLSGAILLAANLQGAELQDVKGLTQKMLNRVRPSPPPRSLPDEARRFSVCEQSGVSRAASSIPDEVVWPFESNNDGQWVRKAGDQFQSVDPVDLSGRNLSGVNFSGVNLSLVNFSKANLSDANLQGADLSGANFHEASGLIQRMLNAVRPSPEPRNLPSGLVWPFVKDDDGQWVRKPGSEFQTHSNP